MTKIPLKECPACKEKNYVVSIFGSICGKCYYSPPREAKYHR